MRYLTLAEALDLHDRLILLAGGARGIRDLAALEAAVSQPYSNFDGQDLYTDLASKAAALCLSLIMNHPFLDGNNRVGHAAMETFLVMNGYEIRASVEEQERTVLALAAGRLARDEFVSWLKEHVVPCSK